ncbi:MAG: metallophosphoesterase [Lentisphaeria bacterium]
MVFLLVFFIFSSIFVSAILPSRMHWGWKAVWSVLTLFAAGKFQILKWFGGPMYFAPNFSNGVLWILSLLFVTVFILMFLLIPVDCVRVAYWFFRVCHGKKPSQKFWQFGDRIHLGLLIVAVILALWGMMNGAKLPEVKEQVIEMNDFPPDEPEVTIAVLSDLHVDKKFGYPQMTQIVAAVNRLKPDLIVLLGDCVDGRIEDRGHDLEPLKVLSAPLGVYGVPGNHEYYSGYYPWMKFFSSLGVDMLVNEHVSLGATNLVLVGVTDAEARSWGYEGPDLEKAMRNVPVKVPVILLSHRPSIAKEAAKFGVDLQLSGHTHGGMLPGLQKIVAKFNGGFVSGLYTVGTMNLYVSNGTGVWNGFPVRLAVPAEITLLRLRGKDKGLLVGE